MLGPSINCNSPSSATAGNPTSSSSNVYFSSVQMRWKYTGEVPSQCRVTCDVWCDSLAGRRLTALKARRILQRRRSHSRIERSGDWHYPKPMKFGGFIGGTNQITRGTLAPPGTPCSSAPGWYTWLPPLLLTHFLFPILSPSSSPSYRDDGML